MDQDWETFDDFENAILPLIITSIVVDQYNLQGELYVQDLLKGDPHDFQEAFRMPRYTYLKLERFFEKKTKLKESDTISIAQKFAMFVWVVGKAASNREVQDQFHHSGETVSRCFHQVLDALLLVHGRHVQQPDEITEIPDRIAESSEFTPFFDCCVGALDGAHIPIRIPLIESVPWINSRGDITQNALAVCDFNMKFTYIFPGWEGAAPNARVLGDAVSKKDFVVPKEGYYLADASYTSADWLLTPYRDVRYRLEEYRDGAGPENAKELFNLRHASLRTVVEQAIGALKQRFKCTRTVTNFSTRNQVRLIFAITAIHNVIQEYKDAAEAAGETDIWEFTEVEQEGSDTNTTSRVVDPPPTDNMYYPASEAMNTKRDEMAEEMWAQYQESMESGEEAAE